MPLDPFFAERLRVHRRYLFAQAVSRAKARVPGAGGAEASSQAPASAARTPTSARERHRRAARAWDRKELAEVGTRGPEVEIERASVPVAGYPDVAVRIYRPAAPASTPSPAVLTFFGGAFRIGGVDYPTTDAEYRRRASEADLAVVAVEYSLAPERRFPTQVEQGHAVLAWMHEHAEDLGLDPERFGIAGTSAGGAIAAAVTLMNRDRARLPLRLQLLEVPVLDLTARYIDLRATWALGIPATIALREMRSVARTYLPSPRDATHPYASPLRAASHSDLPPAVIMTAEFDPLRRSGDAYGAALRRSGVDAAVVRYLGVTHDVPIFTGALPAARVWHAQVIDTLRSLHD